MFAWRFQRRRPNALRIPFAAERLIRAGVERVILNEVNGDGPPSVPMCRREGTLALASPSNKPIYLSGLFPRELLA